MVDLAVVTAVMSALGPYLGMLKEMGGKVLEGTETKLGEKAFELLSARLTGKAKGALDAAKAEPDEDNLAVLETLVKNAATRDEGLAKALAELVKGTGTSMTMTQTGTGNKGVQNVGSGNTFNL